MLRLSGVKPKFHYVNFHRNFPVGKVMDTNHESHGHKRWQIMKPWSFGESRQHKSRKSRIQTIRENDLCICDTNHLDTSRCLRQTPWQVRNKPVCVALMEFSSLQCTGKVGDTVWDQFTTKSQTCRGHKSWKSATWFVSWTFMICVGGKFATLLRTCPGLCRKVGVMEFGLKQASEWIDMQQTFSSVPC